MPVFDVALEKRFEDSTSIIAIDVASDDALLLHDTSTGLVMRFPFSTLTAALVTAFNGTFATLVDGKVPAAQLPSYVDDVLEYANLAGFPVSGETGKIYVAIDTRKTFRWTGSAYVEISPSDVNSVAGKTGIVTLVKADVGLSNVDNTTDAGKPVSTAQATAIALKANSAIEAFIAPTLLNSWVNYGGAYETPGYYKDNFGIVHLRGLVKSGTLSVAIFQLPAGYRPLKAQMFAVISNLNFGLIQINANGDVVPFAPATNAHVCFDGVSFVGV